MRSASAAISAEPPKRAPWAAYLPVVLSVCILVPRLLSPQFGLLDDGYTLSVVQQVAAGDLGMLWERGAARSRPVYWLYFTMLYKIAGPSPFWFFVGNAVLFAATAAGLIYLVRSHGATARRSLITGLLFILAGPVVESYMTLSKPEPLQIALITGSIVSILSSRRRKGAGLRVGGVVAGAFLLLLADLTKETSLALIPISVVWLLGAWRQRRVRPGSSDMSRAASLLLAAASAGIAFLLLRYRFSTIGLPEGAYAGNYLFEAERLVASAVRWSGWLIRDFAYLGPIVLAAAFLPQVRRTALSDPGVLASVVWMAGWVAVYLPWVFTVEYYLLPFALGAAVVGGFLTDHILLSLSSSRGLGRSAAAVGLGFAAFLLVFSVGNNASNARQQMMIDRANEEALRLISTTLPGSSMLLVNLQSPGEYVEEIRLHLIHIWNRPDVRVDYVQMERLPAMRNADGPLFLLEAVVLNQPLLTVRSGAVEVSVREWNRMLEEFVAQSGVLAGRIERELPLHNVNFVRVFCPLMPTRGFCEVDEPLLDGRVYSYGWELYRIVDEGPESRGASPRPAAAREAGRWQ